MSSAPKMCPVCEAFFLETTEEFLADMCDVCHLAVYPDATLTIEQGVEQDFDETMFLYSDLSQREDF